jgi:hypothetical protein
MESEKYEFHVCNLLKQLPNKLSESKNIGTMIENMCNIKLTPGEPLFTLKEDYFHLFDPYNYSTLDETTRVIFKLIENMKGNEGISKVIERNNIDPLFGSMISEGIPAMFGLLVVERLMNPILIEFVIKVACTDGMDEVLQLSAFKLLYIFTLLSNIRWKVSVKQREHLENLLKKNHIELFREIDMNMNIEYKKYSFTKLKKELLELC